MARRPPASVEVRDLGFRYPGAPDQALTEVGFRIEPGERVGLLGPNGAGKSTLMRLACGYLPLPNDGRSVLKVGEYSLPRDSLAIRTVVGYLPELVPLYPELRVREHLDFRAGVKRVRRKQRPAEIERVASMTGLADMLETPIHRLSRGYRQRVGIADALLGSPPLVVLDEPTVGLDPNQVQGIRAMLKDLGGGQTLVFSSHVLAEVEALCDRIIILSRGRVVADEDVGHSLAGNLHVSWVGGAAAAKEVVAKARSALEIDVPTGEDAWVIDGDSVLADLVVPGSEDAEAFARAVGQASLEAGLPVIRMGPGRRALEDRFAEATGFGAENSTASGVRPGGTSG